MLALRKHALDRDCSARVFIESFHLDKLIGRVRCDFGFEKKVVARFEATTTTRAGAKEAGVIVAFHNLFKELDCEKREYCHKKIFSQDTTSALHNGHRLRFSDLPQRMQQATCRHLKI